MKRLLLLTALIATMAILFASSVAAAQSTVRRSYNDLDVDIWTDKDDGSNYYEGDNITIYFRASRDCYVTIYDLDTRGNINLIFPAEPGDNNFIQGDEIYMIPDQGDDFDFTLEGPPGNETIQIVASPAEYMVPDWRGPRSVYDDDWGFKYDGDNDDFIARVNSRYFPDDVSAYDNVSFYVAPRYYYEPEKSDCNGDCGQVYVDYPDGCEVFVNGVFYGYAPLYVPSIYLGRHRVTVYWGASIVYNDWIFVDAWNPYYVYTRPLYVYDFCYTNWYRDHRWDNRWFDGPSRYKYKDRDFYTYKKPDSRRGYSVVTNTHGYEKSKVYADKSSRIDKYKETYKYDKSTKTYTASKGRYDYDKGKAGSSGKSRDFDAYNNSKKPVYGNDNNGTYTKPKSGDTNTGNNAGKGTSRGEVKKPVSKGSVGNSGDVKKPATNSGGKSNGDVRKPATRTGDGKSSGEAKKPVSSGSGNKSSGDVKKPATKSDDGKSGNSQPKTVVPNSGGSKSSPSSVGSPSKSSGSSQGKSSGNSGGGSKSDGNHGGSKRR